MFQVDVANNRVLFLAEAIPLSNEPLLADGSSVATKKNKSMCGELLLFLATCSTLALIIFFVLRPSRSLDNSIDNAVDRSNSTGIFEEGEKGMMSSIGIDLLAETLIEIGWPVTWTHNPSSPQYQAWKWVKDSLVHEMPLSSSTLLERFAFFVLYFATNGKTWTRSPDSMNDGTSNMCDWTEGVICNGDDNSVTQLLLGMYLMTAA
jgi:hypothetical protein